MEASFSHTSVMLAEVIKYLSPQTGGTYIDGTFGRGGYTQAFLRQGCYVIALDRDPEAIAAGAPLAEAYPHHLTLLKGCFADMETLLDSQGLKQVDGLVLDLGVSSPQLDNPQRGFSFRFDGPLDMRMDPQTSLTAAFVVNTYDESQLADIFYYLGEERHSRRVAKTIIHARTTSLFQTTGQLASVIRSVVKPGKDGLDSATRTFQALRLYVNKELEQLEAALKASLNILRPGGRMVVVTFHSLEDRCVKYFFRNHSDRAPLPSRHALPQPERQEHGLFRVLTPKAVRPSAQEVALNPRASSAKLRAIEYGPLGGDR